LIKVLDIIEDGTVVNELTFISTHLAFLVTVIKKLETQNMTLHESFSIIDEIKEKIQAIPGSKGATLKTKLHDLSNKNKGLKILRQINAILLGENDSIQLDDIYQDPTILSCSKYAPTTSVNVERSFSVFKNMLTDIHHSFTEEKLKKFIIHFNDK